MDDFIFIADTHADLLKACALVEDESALLGLSWNPDKDIGKSVPLHAAEILGLTIDTSTMTSTCRSLKGWTTWPYWSHFTWSSDP